MDLAKTSIVQNAWLNKQPLQVHGVVYAVGTGILQDLGVTMDSTDDMENVYRMDVPVIA